jgi:hypothetical protein
MECTDAKTLKHLVSLPKKLFEVAVSSDGIFLGNRGKNFQRYFHVSL